MYIKEFNRDRQRKSLAFSDELRDFMMTLILNNQIILMKSAIYIHLFIHLFIYLFGEVATLFGF